SFSSFFPFAASSTVLSTFLSTFSFNFFSNWASTNEKLISKLTSRIIFFITEIFLKNVNETEGIFAVLKIEVCLFDGNREKISIWYNECYSKKRSASVEIFVHRFGTVMYLQFFIDIM